MSITTSTKSYRDLTKRQAIGLCYILEEQRDRQIARAEKGEAKVAAALKLLGVGWPDQHGDLVVDVDSLRTALAPEDT